MKARMLDGLRGIKYAGWWERWPVIKQRQDVWKVSKKAAWMK